jgi:hypothetical protein
VTNDLVVTEARPDVEARPDDWPGEPFISMPVLALHRLDKWPSDAKEIYGRISYFNPFHVGIALGQGVTAEDCQFFVRKMRDPRNVESLLGREPSPKTD